MGRKYSRTSEESQDPEKKEDKKLENHQEVDQDTIQVVQPPYSPNVTDLDNKKNSYSVRSDRVYQRKKCCH
jgi:hypothetical protein